MEYKKIDGKYIIRINKGENVMEFLTNWCEEKGIHSGVLSGIGAVEFASCGYYNLEEKKYYFTQYNTMLEVLSMTGNVAIKEGKPFLHVHAVFSGEDNKAFGGHVEEMRVGVVLEVVLEPLSKEIVREHDECIGLYLMNLEN